MQSRFKKYGLLRRYKEQVSLCYAEFRREYKGLGTLLDGISPRNIDAAFSTTDKKFDVHEWRLNIESIKEQIKLLQLDLRRYAVSIVSPFVKVLTLIQIKAKARLKQLKALIQTIPDTPPEIIADLSIFNI